MRPLELGASADTESPLSIAFLSPRLGMRHVLVADAAWRSLMTQRAWRDWVERELVADLELTLYLELSDVRRTACWERSQWAFSCYLPCVDLTRAEGEGRLLGWLIELLAEFCRRYAAEVGLPPPPPVCGATADASRGHS